MTGAIAINRGYRGSPSMTVRRDGSWESEGSWAEVSLHAGARSSRVECGSFNGEEVNRALAGPCDMGPGTFLETGILCMAGGEIWWKARLIVESGQ